MKILLTIIYQMQLKHHLQKKKNQHYIYTLEDLKDLNQ